MSAVSAFDGTFSFGANHRQRVADRGDDLGVCRHRAGQPHSSCHEAPEPASGAADRQDHRGAQLLGGHQCVDEFAYRFAGRIQHPFGDLSALDAAVVAGDAQRGGSCLVSRGGPGMILGLRDAQRVGCTGHGDSGAGAIRELQHQVVARRRRRVAPW